MKSSQPNCSKHACNVPTRGGPILFFDSFSSPHKTSFYCQRSQPRTTSQKPENTVATKHLTPPLPPPLRSRNQDAVNHKRFFFVSLVWKEDQTERDHRAYLHLAQGFSRPTANVSHRQTARGEPPAGWPRHSSTPPELKRLLVKEAK